MSAYFTTPADADWQTLLDELTLAWSERRQVLGQDAYAAEDGRDVQAAAYWAAMQGWVLSYYTQFADWKHAIIPDPVLFGSTEQLSYFTTPARFYSTAGMASGGFRRATAWDGISDPVWSYGLMQADDIIGPWIFEDLHSAFSALRYLPSSPSQTKLERETATSDADCAAALADFLTGFYSPDDWNPWSGAPVPEYGSFGAYFSTDFNGSLHSFMCQELKNSVILSVPAGWTADIFAHARNTGSPWVGDMYGLGLVVDEWGKIIAGQTGTISRTFALETSPQEQLGISCPVSNWSGACYVDMTILRQPPFTNQNG